MPDILIRNLSKETVDALKARAKRHGRSLQQELGMALERLSEEHEMGTLASAMRIRERIRAEQGILSDSTELIRDDRDNR